jgi:TRAP-type C4-dicarboxylate transport system substrate-binding protein
MRKETIVQCFRTSLVGIIFLMLIVCPATVVWASGGKTVVLKYASYAPPTHLGTIIAQAEFPSVEKMTEGRVKVEVYHSESLFPARETVNALDKGIADLAFYPLNYMAGQIPWFNATLVPGLIKDSGAAHSAFKNGLTELVQKDILALGLKVQIVGTPFSPGMSYLMTKGKKVANPDGDLKGMKIACPAKGDMEVVKLLGGTPVAMPSTESYEAMTRGVVNGVVSNIAGMYGRKMFEPGDYLTMVPLGTAVVAVLASQSGMSKVSDVDRSIVLYVAEKRLLEETYATASLEHSYLTKMLPHLKEVVYPTRDQLTKWQAKLAPIQDNYLKTYGDKGKQVVSIIKKYEE